MTSKTSIITRMSSESMICIKSIHKCFFTATTVLRKKEWDQTPNSGINRKLKKNHAMRLLLNFSEYWKLVLFFFPQMSGFSIAFICSVWNEHLMSTKDHTLWQWDHVNIHFWDNPLISHDSQWNKYLIFNKQSLKGVVLVMVATS